MNENLIENVNMMNKNVKIKDVLLLPTLHYLEEKINEQKNCYCHVIAVMVAYFHLHLFFQLFKKREFLISNYLFRWLKVFFYHNNSFEKYVNEKTVCGRYLQFATETLHPLNVELIHADNRKWWILSIQDICHFPGKNSW